MHWVGIAMIWGEQYGEWACNPIRLNVRTETHITHRLLITHVVALKVFIKCTPVGGCAGLGREPPSFKVMHSIVQYRLHVGGWGLAFMYKIYLASVGATHWFPLHRPSGHQSQKVDNFRGVAHGSEDTGHDLPAHTCSGKLFLFMKPD